MRSVVRLLRPLAAVALLALAALLAARFLARAPVVIDAAMRPALWPGDRLLLDRDRVRFARGAIVAFHDREGRTDFARIVGLPGERWGLVAGRPRSDGRALVRRRVADLLLPPPPGRPCPTPLEAGACRVVRHRELLPGGTLVDTIETPGSPATLPDRSVPTDVLFLLRDDRAGAQPGLVPTDAVIGRVRAILWSQSAPLDWRRPFRLVPAMRRDRLLIGVEPVAPPR